MSRLSEYLKLIPEGLKNIDGVIDGFKNQVKEKFGSLSEEEQEEIVRRRLICAQCPYMSKNAAAAKIYATNRVDDHCIHCGCPIETRTASLISTCGIATYNKKHPEAPMELKWDKFLIPNKPKEDVNNETDRQEEKAD